MSTLAEVFRQLTGALHELEIPFLIGGSVGASAHGLLRQTNSIDIIAEVETENLARTSVARFRVIDTDFGAHAFFAHRTHVAQGLELFGDFLHAVVEAIEHLLRQGVGRFHFEQNQVIEERVDEVLHGAHGGAESPQLGLFDFGLKPFALAGARPIHGDAGDDHANGQHRGPDIAGLRLHVELDPLHVRGE